MQLNGLKFIKFFAQTSIILLLTACVTESSRISPIIADADLRADNSAKRAVSYMDLKQYETAENILEKALKDAPNHSIANYTFALLKLRIGEAKKAGKFFKAAIKNDSNNSSAAHDYGYFLCGQGEIKEGLEMFDLAISNALFRQRGLSNLRAGECIFTNDKNRAEKYFLAAYKEAPKLSVSLFRLAELNFSRKKVLSARAYYQRYAAVQVDSAASLHLAYKIEVLAGSKGEALIHRTSLLKKFPGSDEAKLVREKY